MKRPDLLMLIAIWEFLTAVFALIGLSALVILALQQPYLVVKSGRQF